MDLQIIFSNKLKNIDNRKLKLYHLNKYYLISDLYKLAIRANVSTGNRKYPATVTIIIVIVVAGFFYIQKLFKLSIL